VSILNDNPVHRGNIVYSITSGQMALLDQEGKLHHFDRPQAQAILCLFDEMNDRAVESTPFWRWLAMTKEAKKILVPVAA
jgi:hypothetical protein